MWLVIFHPSRSTVVLSCPVPRGIPRFSFFYSAGSDAGLFVCLFPGIECRCSLFCSRVFSPAAFLCSVPLPVSRPLFLFCRMLSGLFVCLFPGIECRCSSFCSRVFSLALFLVLFPAVFRGFLSSFPRHRVPVFFPLYGEVGSSLVRFNAATISRPLRTSTARLFFVLFAGL